MHTSIIPSIRIEAWQSVTREDLLALANFCDEHEHAVSFYFSLSLSPDNSHREEVLMIKQLIRDIVTKRETEDGVSKDLGAIVTIAEEVRHTPSRLKAVFACHDQHIWRVFDLPAFGSVSRLDVGRHFHLAPLLRALESSAPYCVVMIERGKARGFLVHGTEIREMSGRFRAGGLNLHPDDSRVGWSHHVDGNLQEAAKAYLKRLSSKIHQFMEEHKCTRLVVGCREDLWSEVEPQLLGPERAAVIGRFHTPNFDVSSAEVLQAAKPIFEESLHKPYKDLLHKINEGSSHSAVGLDQVLESLEEGRVQKLLVGKRSDERISECQQCSHLHAGVGSKCVFCGSSNTHAILAEEALIRKALLTEAEILLPGPGASSRCDGVAAWLRY